MSVPNRVYRGARARASTVKWWADAKIRGYQAKDIELADMEKILDDLGVGDERSLVVYSAWQVLRLKAKPNQLIDLLLARLAPDGLLAFPTAPFDGTLFDYLRPGPTFNLKFSPSCRGLLTEVARRRKDSFRTPQPACPFSILGRDAEAIADRHRDLRSGYSADSLFGECLAREGATVTLGIGWMQNSIMHYAEKCLDETLGGFSKELLPYKIKKGNEIVEAESEYLLPCDRDRKYVDRRIRKHPAFRELRRHGVDYSRVPDRVSYDAFADAIETGRFRRRAV